MTKAIAWSQKYKTEKEIKKKTDTSQIFSPYAERRK